MKEKSSLVSIRTQLKALQCYSYQATEDMIKEPKTQDEEQQDTIWKKIISSVEKGAITAAVNNASNQSQAATHLGISVSTLKKKVKHHFQP